MKKPVIRKTLTSVLVDDVDSVQPYDGHRCAYRDCSREANTVAQGRGDIGSPLAAYCETHANMVADEDSPEYVTHCPNCCCIFGVN